LSKTRFLSSTSSTIEDRIHTKIVSEQEEEALSIRLKNTKLGLARNQKLQRHPRVETEKITEVSSLTMEGLS
jgi:hypothetical protein